MKINNVTANNTAKPVAFTSNLGNVGKNILETYIEPQRKGNMSRNLFVTTAFAFLLSGRIFNSRDNNEKRETVTRDIPTILLAINGVPLFEKITAKILQKKTGVAIYSEKPQDKGLFALLIDNFQKKNTADTSTNSKTLTIASADQINDWYRFDKTLASGFDGFMTRLKDLDGNLKKITSKLSEDIKGKLTNFSSNNDIFMKQLSSKEHKGLKQTIMDEFGKEGNAALKDASFKKSLPKLAGIATTLVLVGLCIPKANIALTEYLSKKKKTADSKPSETVKSTETTQAAEAAKVEQNTAVSNPIETAKTEPVTTDMQTANMKTAQNSSSDSTKKAFAQFIN